MSNEMISLIIKLLILTLSTFITTIIVPYIKERIGQSKFDELQEYIEFAVRCAEQIFTIDEFKEKKEYVTNYVVRKAQELDIELTEKDIDILIEGIVNLVKHNYSQPTKEGK